MSFSPDPQDRTFSLIASEEERQAAIAFIRRNKPFFDRLADVFQNAPASAEDGWRILDTPVYVTVGTSCLSMARTRRKNRRVPEQAIA